MQITRQRVAIKESATPNLRMQSVAIIGTGIAGMACAHRLGSSARITLFEAASEAGGHTHTRDIETPDGVISVDTGFMVYNEVTYPLLTALFDELGVETVDTDMSFGVQHLQSGLEFCGSGLGGLLAQPANLLKPAFIGLIRDILRFNKLSNRDLQHGIEAELSLGDYVRQKQFGRAFLDQYLLPMTGAIWSTPPDQMLEFPAQTLLRFMFNHGLLGVRTHHQWRTVAGGSRQYRDKILAPFRKHLHCNRPVKSIHQGPDGVRVVDKSDTAERFDKVVVATHADTALRLLKEPTGLQRRLLNCFSYSDNDIKLHSDLSVMPKAKRAWAAWNYRLEAAEKGSCASTHYWMNKLQHIRKSFPVLVSLNDPGLVDDRLVHANFSFSHPTFTLDAIKAQQHLPELNQDADILFCGSYFRYGFHEDGLQSGYNAAKAVLGSSATNEQLAV